MRMKRGMNVVEFVYVYVGSGWLRTVRGGVSSRDGESATFGLGSADVAVGSVSAW